MKFYILGPIIIAIILFIIFSLLIFQYRSLLISKKIRLYILIPLRIISITILLTLLLEPYLSYLDYSSDNKLNIYIDSSKSVQYNNINSDSLISIIQYFKNWKENSEIEIQVFVFGDSIREYGKQIYLEDNSTNFFDLKSHVERNLHVTNLIITDGNSTEGYSLSDINFDCPVNFIGLGFLNYEDISITDVKHKHSISREDSFKIDFSINSELEIESNSKLIISSNKLVVYEENILLDKGKNKYNKSIKIPSNNLNPDFQIEVKNSLLIDNKFNNTYKGRVQITDHKKEVLLISGSLNPNTKNIKDILNLIPDLNLRHTYKSKNGWIEEIEKIKIQEYDLIVYDNFPLDNQDSRILSFIENNSALNVKYVLFEGPSFTLNSFNQINKELSIEIIKRDKNSKYVLLDNHLSKFLPSLDRNFKIYKDKFKEIYLQYSDSTIAIAEDEKYLFLSMPDLSSLSIKDLSGIINQRIAEIVYKYMDSGSSIRLSIPDREIYTNQDLKFYLEFPDIYNISDGELVIHNVDLRLKYNIKLNQIKKASDGIRYLDNLKEGKNILNVSLLNNNKAYKSNSLELIVKDNNLELQEVYRNSDDMKDLAIKSNGNYYDIEEYNTIKPWILNSIKIKNKKIELDVHSFDKFWFILLITLIIEWFFRKQKGLL